MGSRALKGIAGPVAVSRVLESRAVESRFDALRQEQLTPLVGREDETALLRRRWKLASGGEGQVALICAEPGIGKSRLCENLRERLTGEPHTTLRYQCSPYHTNSSFYPIINQIERSARFESTDSASDKFGKLKSLLAHSSDEVSGVASLFAALLSIPAQSCYEPLEFTPRQWREQTLAALMAQLKALAARQPVLVVFEDVHWVDPSSRQLLDTMIEAIRAERVLMLITFRPEFQPPWVGEAHVRLLSLTKLNDRQCASMVARVAGDRSLPASLIDQILDKTDGIPLFVEELTKAILESGPSDGTPLEDVGVTDASVLAIPSTMQDSLMARLDRLGSAKDVAQIGAVIGREFEFELLSAVTSLSDTELDASIATVIESGLVSRSGSGQRTSFVFKHALIRDAAYESLLKSRRRELHASIAKALSSQFADRASVEPELFARHYSEAGLASEAATYWLRAAEKSAAEFANEEGVRHAIKGLAEIETLPETDARDDLELQLQIVLGACLRVSKGFAAPDTVRAFTRAWSLCERVGSTVQRALTLRGLFGIAYLAGDLNEVMALGDRALSLSTEDSQHSAYGHMMRGVSMLYRGKFGDARRELEEFLLLFDKVPPKPNVLSTQSDNKVIALTHLGIALMNLGFPERALAVCESAMERARWLEAPLSLAMALNHVIAVRVGNRQSFSRENQDLIRWVQEHGIVYWKALASIWNGIGESLVGEHESAIQRIRTGVDEHRAQGSHLAFPWLISELAAAQLRAGDAQGALASIDEGTTSMERNGERMSESVLLMLKAEVMLSISEDAVSEAEILLKQAIAVARAQDGRMSELKAATRLARLLHARGCSAEAKEVLSSVYDWYTEGFEYSDLVEARALLDEFE
jgi:tetratricopeptide (TPR) repeat protein